MGTPTPTETRPRGPEQVRAAVLAATRGLLIERGLDGFTVRDIASAGGVNHALVHRYFGTKADVLEAVLAEESSAIVAAVAQARELATRGTERRVSTPQNAGLGEVLAALEGQPIFWRALAHAVLGSPESAIPGTARTTEFFSSLWSGAGEERAAEVAVAGATVLGWMLFGTFMTDSTGADPDAVRRVVADQVARLTT